jgi:predicted nucleic acid-binding protein
VKRPLRIYIDTSVIGGCLDDEFAKPSEALLAMAARGEVRLLVSEVLTRELGRAPAAVRQVLDRLPAAAMERVTLSPEAERLRDAYLAAGVVDERSATDAHHGALATVARADIIVSWNFKHIVHVERIRGFNGVNLLEGHGPLEIRSPLEVV